MKAARTPRDFWFWTTLCIAALFAIFLVYPLFSLFASSFVDPDSGGFTLAHYAQFFKKRYYYRALLNSMSVTQVSWVLCEVLVIVLTSTSVGLTVCSLAAKMPLCALFWMHAFVRVLTITSVIHFF